jgi:hypothetical protein
VIDALGKTLVVHVLFLGALPDFLCEDYESIHSNPFFLGADDAIRDD